MTILAYLQALLDEKAQPCTLLAADEQVPYERLIVALEGLAFPQNALLEVRDYVENVEEDFVKEHSMHAHLIQFQSVLPLTVMPDTFNQVASALHFFNRLLHCPGFELDELSDQILYRYMWFVKKNGIDAALIKQVVDNIALCLHLFSPYVQGIAEGRYTLEAILEEVVQLAKASSS